MKKILILALIVLVLGSCSTYYGKYDYNRYFQNNEPYVVVDSEEDAAAFIARKLARRFRRTPHKTLSVLAFTDEYGDRINRGDFFARMVVAEMTRYNNPMVVERESLYELIKERELSMTNLLANEGYELEKLLQADYILHGRILRGKHEDMISVRCFEVGTGQVVYAATVSIDYTPDPIPTPMPPTHDDHIIIIDPGSPSPNPLPPPVITKPEPKPEPKEPNKKPGDGTISGGKIDLDNIKTRPNPQDDKKKKEPYTKPVKKPKPVVTRQTTNTTVDIKENTPVIKSKPVKETPQVKEPVNNEEEKKKETKKSSSSKNKKKTTTIKK
jgi:TolB-like protein